MSLARKDGHMLRSQTVQSSDLVQAPAFKKGDSIILSKGPDQGTVGTFLNYKDDDPTWADILDQKARVRSHPVELLQPSTTH
jgi:hypothetical protein